jgi:predicted TPR repeat methyltransferase
MIGRFDQRCVDGRAFVGSQSHDFGARSILELGCGTGIHAEFLAKVGYHVSGVDLSEGMLARQENVRLNSQRILDDFESVRHCWNTAYREL